MFIQYKIISSSSHMATDIKEIVDTIMVEMWELKRAQSYEKVSTETKDWTFLTIPSEVVDIKINDAIMKAILQRVPNLTSLIIEGFCFSSVDSDVTEKNFIECLRILPKLTGLCLSRNNYYSGDFIKNIAKDPILSKQHPCDTAYSMRITFFQSW